VVRSRLSVLVACALAAAPPPGAAEDAQASLFRVLRDGKWGFIDAKGRIAIPPAFDRAADFSEGLAAVQRGTAHGYLDRRGEMVLVPGFAPAGPVHRRFSGGLAVVRVGAAFGYMDRRGTLAFGRTFEHAEDFSDGYALVCGENAGCGLIDRAGRRVVGPGFRGAMPSRGEVACTVVMQMMGRVRVALHRMPAGTPMGEFDGCGVLSEGLVAVQIGGLWGYLDASGKGVLPPAYRSAGEFAGGLAPVRDDASGLCGYVRRDGTFAIEPRFRSCSPFSGGLARVDLAREESEPERIAFVDPAGKPVVVGSAATPPFDSAADFAGGLAAVGSGGEPFLAAPGGPRLGYVDASGRYVWTPRN
jgi:hypothetical protein